MAKSKFSKKQIAGTLLLSSAAIGAVASGTASANKFTDFLRKTGELVKIAVGDKIGNKLDGHEQIVGTVVGTVTVGLLFALTYGTYRAIIAGVDYYHSANKKNNREKREKFFKDQKKNNKDIENIEKNEKKILEKKGSDTLKIVQGSGDKIEIDNKVDEKTSKIQSNNNDKTEEIKNIISNPNNNNQTSNIQGGSNTKISSDNNIKDE